ncbi:MAG: MFS transporter, partial [Aeromicrobium sp.]
VLYTLTRLTPVPKDATAEVVRATVDHNSAVFPWFLLAFMFVFAAAGIGNGSTYRMIPLIWRTQAMTVGKTGSPERVAADAKATKEASAVIGLAGAVGALGGFLIPITFGAPWVTDPAAAVKSAFVIFSVFYVVCLAVTWAVYLRRGAPMAKAGV